jgi:hypothetical protein
MTKTGFRAIAEASNSGEWQKSTLPRKEFAIPQYIMEALEANKKALDNFNKLANTYRRHSWGGLQVPRGRKHGRNVWQKLSVFWNGTRSLA